MAFVSKQKCLIGLLLFPLLFFPLLIQASSLPKPDIKLTQEARLVWRSLLHQYNGESLITDERFLLEKHYVAAEQSVSATLTRFQQDPQIICQFPARYVFIQRYLPSVDLPGFPVCPEYQEFLDKAPAEQISIVFASENIVSPMSMLGHGMLSLSGKNKSGSVVHHSVSFFVEVSSKDPFTMTYETLLSGKAGVFQVAPLSHYYEYYNKREERNVWRYELALTREERALLQAHMWELKAVDIPYYFDTHNCATLSFDILKVIRPNMERASWLSPSDLVKAANKSALIGRIDITPSDQWRYRMMRDVSPSKVNKNVDEWVSTGQLSKASDANSQYLQVEQAKAALGVMLFDEQIGEADYLKKRESLDSSIEKSDRQLNLSDYKSPLKAPNDSQIGMGLRMEKDSPWVTFRWLPIGHGLEDNNHQYFSENELKLGELEVKYSPQKQISRVHRFQLYSAKVLTPRESLVGGISGGLGFGWEPVYDDELNALGAWNLEGGIGAAKNLTKDINAYGLMNLGVFHQSVLGARGYLEPEVGVFVNEIWDMKSWLSYSQRYISDMKDQSHIKFTQSLYQSDKTILLSVEQVTSGSRSYHQYELAWKYLY